jgi:hypothetical protein
VHSTDSSHTLVGVCRSRSINPNQVVLSRSSYLAEVVPALLSSILIFNFSQFLSAVVQMSNIGPWKIVSPFPALTDCGIIPVVLDGVVTPRSFFLSALFPIPYQSLLRTASLALMAKKQAQIVLSKYGDPETNFGAIDHTAPTN